MPLTCEICGSPIRAGPSRVRIDGAVLLVCQRCGTHGTPVATPAPAPVRHRAQVAKHDILSEPEMEVDPDYNTIVKSARERMGITQEALGRAINIKPSVISHIESKKLKPDLVLARTLMHYLKVDLLVRAEELDSP